MTVCVQLCEPLEKFQPVPDTVTVVPDFDTVIPFNTTHPLVVQTGIKAVAPVESVNVADALAEASAATVPKLSVTVFEPTYT